MTDQPIPLLEQLTVKIKRHTLLKLLAKSSVWWVIAGFVLIQITASLTLSLSAIFVVLTLAIGLLGQSFWLLTYGSVSQIQPKLVIEHLNRLFPELEESAQLLFTTDDKYSLLQQLQYQKLSPILEEILSKKQTVILGKFKEGSHLFIAFIVALALLFLPDLIRIDNFDTASGSESLIEKQQSIIQAKLLASQLDVISPRYTNIKQSQQSSMNVKVIAGAKLQWTLEFSDLDKSYWLVFANGKVLSLVKNGEHFQVSTNVFQTGLYQIKADEQLLPQIYTIEVVKDKRPSIRIVSPKNMVTELAKNSELELVANIQVTDDFGISKVDILASIAKGSGEAVKFRDQVFDIEKISQQQDEQFVAQYRKHWQLTQLDMEPGDELYFTVRAWDNQYPEPQLARSNTKIIRWLDDDTQMVISDGVLIDFMPEYFKSQRQIIIETKELIADQNQLSEEKFTETSELLGVAQSELKQKYGQYLGDEFEEGGAGPVAPQNNGVADGAHHGEEDEEGDDEHDDHQGHGHESNFSKESVGITSGKEQLLAEYAHTHEDSDIGMMSSEDPRALMKRSIANMWEAELFLMLSKPEQALPYEEQALKFLKLAKKAERIYVKRLGFEPPPVTEKRRYQGELDDINSQEMVMAVSFAESDYKKLNRLFSVLNEHLNQAQNSELLSPSVKKIVLDVKDILSVALSNRPGLIAYVATLEKILIANRLSLIDCDDCLDELRNKIWQLMPTPEVKINGRTRSNYSRIKLSTDYLDQVSQLDSAADHVGGNK